jgi:hypothetical protein
MYYDEISYSSRERHTFTYPSTLSQAVEAKLVCDLGSVHGILYRGLGNSYW